MHEQPWRRFFADAILWLGRLLLIGVPLYALWCRYAYDGWRGVPQQDGLPAAGSFELLALGGLLWGAMLPWVLIPMGPAARSEVADQRLRVRTVLGTRTIRLDGVRLRSWMLWGEWRATRLTSIRRGWRWVVVAESGLWPRPRSLTVLPRARATWVSWVKGWGLILLCVFSVFIGWMLVMWLAAVPV